MCLSYLHSSSRRAEVFHENAMKNFAKVCGKHLRWSSFLKKLQADQNLICTLIYFIAKTWFKLTLQKNKIKKVVRRLYYRKFLQFLL